ncbi:MAG: alkaline phosphatase family protein, partial [Vicinamibacterales bacterium]
MSRGRVKLLALLVVAVSSATIVAQRGQAVPAGATPVLHPPRLVVMIVVDQMRADYISLYGHQWTKGLRRLVDTSAMFPLAAYPYTLTVTCPGHATVSTGSFPSTHGMAGNEWYDRELRRSVSCTENTEFTDVPFGGRTATDHHGLARLKVPTFADELRLQSPRRPTIVSISLKPRSALNLAGRPSPSTYPIWEENNGTWATSSAYTSKPWPVVDQYVTA